MDSEYLLTLVEAWVENHPESGYQHVYMDNFVILMPDKPVMHAVISHGNTRWGKLTSISINIEVPDDERYPGYSYGWLNLPPGHKVDSDSFCTAVDGIYKVYDKHSPYAKFLKG